MNFSATEAWSRSVWSVPRDKRTLILMLAMFVFALVCDNTARANTSRSGQIAGTVIDQSGATVGGATGKAD